MIYEKILCAAIYWNDGIVRDPSVCGKMPTGFVLCGWRHNQCINAFAERFGYPYSDEIKELKRTEIQGFLTSNGRFVDRKEAMQIAKEQGQVISERYDHPAGLFSEDLY